MKNLNLVVFENWEDKWVLLFEIDQCSLQMKLSIETLLIELYLIFCLGAGKGGWLIAVANTKSRYVFRQWFISQSDGPK